MAKPFMYLNNLTGILNFVQFCPKHFFEQKINFNTKMCTYSGESNNHEANFIFIWVFFNLGKGKFHLMNAKKVPSESPIFQIFT